MHGKRELSTTRKTRTSCSLFLGRLRLLVGSRGFLPRGDCCDWVTTRKTRTSCSLFLGRLRLLAGIRGFLPRGEFDANGLRESYTENATCLWVCLAGSTNLRHFRPSPLPDPSVRFSLECDIHRQNLLSIDGSFSEPHDAASCS